MTLCWSCDLPIPPESEPHWDHGPDCERRPGWPVCRCDLRVHEDCCRSCALDAFVLEPT